MHWSERYVGLPYRDGTQDCAAFTVRVQREQFARDILLPVGRPGGHRERSQMILDLRGDYAARTEAPVEGDAVLMQGRGRLSHIGTLVLIAGTSYVLHAMKDAGQVCLHRVRDLAAYGLVVEGYYRWK